MKKRALKMSFLKKNFKLIIGIIIGSILISGLSVYATIKYLAVNVSYNNTDVATALDDLYSKAPTKDNVKITESATNINVMDAKTIDTSALYPKSQDGDGIFFRRYTIQLDANGHYEISNIGFMPNTVVAVYSKNSGSEKSYEYKNRNNSGHYFTTKGEVGNLNASDSTIVFGTNNITINGTSYWKNATVYVVVYKGLY